MEYQYDKLQEYWEEVIPLEEVLKKARIVENLHELINNPYKNIYYITKNSGDLKEYYTARNGE